MTRKKTIKKITDEEQSFSPPEETKASRPKISKEDLSKFVDNSSKSNELEIGEAVGVIEGLLALLKSTKMKDPELDRSQEIIPMPCFNECEKRHWKLEELKQARKMRIFLRWGLRIGVTAIIGLLGLFFKYYTNPFNPIKEKLSSQEELILENRKILSLIGKREGWEINENGKGYKTPWEVKLNGTGKPIGGTGTTNKTNKNSTP